MTATSLSFLTPISGPKRPKPEGRAALIRQRVQTQCLQLIKGSACLTRLAETSTCSLSTDQPRRNRVAPFLLLRQIILLYLWYYNA
jgi:hypothetical protein